MIILPMIGIDDCCENPALPKLMYKLRNILRVINHVLISFVVAEHHVV